MKCTRRKLQHGTFRAHQLRNIVMEGSVNTMTRRGVVDRGRNLPASLVSTDKHHLAPKNVSYHVAKKMESPGISPTPKTHVSTTEGQYRPSIEQAHHSNDCCRTATGAGRLLNTALATTSDRITTTGCDGVEPREAAAACQRSPQPKRAPKAPGVRSCHCHRSCGVSLLDAYAGLGKKVSLWPFRLAITTWRGPLSGHSPSPTTPESSHNAKRCLECFKLS